MPSKFANAPFRAAFPVLVLLLLAGPLEAQVPREQRDFLSGTRTGVGYVGVLPEALVGVGGFHFVGQHPLGVFADIKTTALSGIRNDADYCPSPIAECNNAWVESQRNDPQVDEATEWLAFNAGIAFILTREFAVLLGGGMARETLFHEFFDNNEDQAARLTDSGAYYVEDEAGPSWRAQAVLGVLLRAGRNVAFRLGYETAIGGLGLGAYFRLR